MGMYQLTGYSENDGLGTPKCKYYFVFGLIDEDSSFALGPTVGTANFLVGSRIG